MRILSASNGFTVINIIELIVALLFFHSILDKKEHAWWRVLVGAIGCIAVSALLPMITDPSPVAYIFNGIFLFLATFMLSILFARYVYNDEIWTLIFCATCAYTIQNLGSTVDSILGYVTQILAISIDKWALSLAAYVVVYGFIFLAARRIMHKYERIRIDNKRMLLVAGLSLVLEIILGMILYYIEEIHPDNIYLLMTQFYHALGCILVLALETTLLYDKTLSLELARSEQMLHEQSKQFETSRHTIDLINIKSHDLKNQIRAIARNAVAIEQDEINQINKAIDDYDAMIHTGNEALDVIITEKSFVCRQKDIVFTCMCDAQAVDMLAKNEIYSLFGNALDNAIEAAQQVIDPKKRVITVNIKTTHALSLIHIQNSYATEPEIENNVLTTIKSDHDNHGIGMRSMKRIVQAHDGFMNFETKEGIFHLSIMIPRSH